MKNLMKKLNKNELQIIGGLRICLYLINIIWIALFIAVIIIIPLYLWSEVSWSLPSQDRAWESHARDNFEFGSEEFVAWKNSRPMHMGYRIIIQFSSFIVGLFICNLLFMLQGKLLGILGNRLIAAGKRLNVLDKIVAVSVIGITEQSPDLWAESVQTGSDCTVVTDFIDERANKSNEDLKNALLGISEKAADNMKEEAK